MLSHKVGCRQLPGRRCASAYRDHRSIDWLFLRVVNVFHRKPFAVPDDLRSAFSNCHRRATRCHRFHRGDPKMFKTDRIAVFILAVSAGMPIYRGLLYRRTSSPRGSVHFDRITRAASSPPQVFLVLPVWFVPPAKTNFSLLARNPPWNERRAPCPHAFYYDCRQKAPHVEDYVGLLPRMDIGDIDQWV